MFIPDCIEYGQYTTGQRNAGTSFCLISFVSKLNSAIISSLTAFVIAAMGFSATSVTAQGRAGVWVTYTLFATVGCIIAIPILLKYYKLRDIRTDKGEFNRWIKATNSVIRDVKKKITALLDWLKEMKAEMAKPQTMDLFAMLQLYFDQRNAGSYSQRAKVNNLKEYSELCQYLLDHGITDITALENHVNDLRTTTDSLKKKLDTQTAQMKTLRNIPEYFDDYKRLKPVFDGLQKIKFTKAREKYKAEHTNDLKRFY